MENVTVTFGFRGKLIVNHPNFCSHEAIFTGHLPFGYNNPQNGKSLEIKQQHNSYGSRLFGRIGWR